MWRKSKMDKDTGKFTPEESDEVKRIQTELIKNANYIPSLDVYVISAHDKTSFYGIACYIWHSIHDENWRK